MAFLSWLPLAVWTVTCRPDKPFPHQHALVMAYQSSRELTRPAALCVVGMGAAAVSMVGVSRLTSPLNLRF